MDLKQTTVSGPTFGLQLTLYANVYEPLYYYLAYGLGVIVRIENSSHSKYYSSGEGILLSPGSQTNIAVDREFKSMLPRPYSKCEVEWDSEIYNVIDRSDFVYTRKLCFIQCYQD